MVNRLITCSIALFWVLSACRPAGETPSATSTLPATTRPLQTEPVLSPATLTSEPTVIPPTPTQTLPVTEQRPTPTPLQASAPTETNPSAPTEPARQTQAIIIDHTSVDLFDQIPEEYLAKARELRMMYADASVGQNINEALNCLTAANWAASAAPCRNDYTDEEWNWKTFNAADLSAGRVPARILFTPDPVKYDRSNWVFEPLPGDWRDITKDFIESLAPSHLDTADVLSYQFNYFHVAEFSNIANPSKGFFVEQPGQYDFTDLEAFIAQHPNKTFFFWTTSLARNIGSQNAVDFNNQMRQYAVNNDLILFDVADIESHTDQGLACYDSRDGVEYCSRRADGSVIKCENEPDDQLEMPAICQDYTTEPDAGHLGSVSSGGLRLAKAFWVLMARIAGWQP